MRLRLGLLNDTAAIEREAAKDAAEAAAKKKKLASAPTVQTEAQAKAEEKAIAKAKKEGDEPPKPAPKPRIRPLSEAKAVETGANFISEGFLFGVAGGLILFEAWRSRRKENTRREDVADRLNDLEESEKAARRALVELEREVLHMRAKDGKSAQIERRILPRSVYEVEEREEREDEDKSKGWLTRIANYISKRGAAEDNDAVAASVQDSPGPAEQILLKSDQAIDAKHKAVEAEKVTAERQGKGV